MKFNQNQINWNDGQLITMGEGDTATCTGNLNNGQLYCLFFYNSAQNDANTTVNVVWSNSGQPVQVNVPGTTAKQGLAALCFIDGSQTSTVSAAVTHANPGAQIEAFICSVKMPMGGSGINNSALPLDSNVHDFTKFTRYYAVPGSHWYSGQIQSNIDQFICVQFKEYQATVFVVNQLVDPSMVIKYAGNAEKLVTLESSENQSVQFNLQGNAGQQYVWMNADSAQNSNSATIVVQSLSGLTV